MDFIKYSAQGNDYIVIDPNKIDFATTPENIMKLCNRRTGIGADGVLYGPHLDNDAFGLFTYNADGSPCAKSGNGLRVFSRYLLDQDYCQDDDIKITLLPDNTSVDVFKVSTTNQFIVNMGSYSFEPRKEDSATCTARPLRDEHIALCGQAFSLSCVNLGNRYAVIIPREQSELTLDDLLPPLIALDILPPRCNVVLARNVEHSSMEIACWEPGAGITQASGGGACAAMAVCFEMGLVEGSTLIKMPGGNVSTFIDRDGSTILSGSVAHIYSGFFSLDFEKTTYHVNQHSQRMSI